MICLACAPKTSSWMASPERAPCTRFVMMLSVLLPPASPRSRRYTAPQTPTARAVGGLGMVGVAQARSLYLSDTLLREFIVRNTAMRSPQIIQRFLTHYSQMCSRMSVTHHVRDAKARRGMASKRGKSKGSIRPTHDREKHTRGKHRGRGASID